MNRLVYTATLSIAAVLVFMAVLQLPVNKQHYTKLVKCYISKQYDYCEDYRGG